MGYAVGVIGLQLEDFDAMTMPEFEAVADAYREQCDSQMRDEWERMRLLACISIQPHCRKKLTPRTLLPLPWDAKKTEAPDAPQYTREEHEACFRKLVEEAKKR